ncbi:IS3 family transposase [Maridesulfovibrio hydrothermalis]
MGLQAITPGPHTSKLARKHRFYPYLLRDVEIKNVNQVWSADITYIPMRRGFMYLAAVIDWRSRYVLAWELPNTMESEFCMSALNQALETGTPQVFNTDQGAHFTSNDFTGKLREKKIAISMDGRGRALDNVFVEKLWWTVKYEDVYPKEYPDGASLYQGFDRYFRYYNEERKHSSLDKRTPAEVFRGTTASNLRGAPPSFRSALSPSGCPYGDGLHSTMAEGKRLADFTLIRQDYGSGMG